MAKKSFLNQIGTTFNSIGALKDEAPENEIPENENSPADIHAEVPKAVIPAVKVETFEELTAPYTEGFYVIRRNDDDNIIAVGLDKKFNDGEDFILKNIESTNAFKNGAIDYTLLPQKNINIFKKDWKRGELKIYNTKEGLDAIIKLDSISENDMDAKLKKEGFVLDDDCFGEYRKISVVLPVKFIRYCKKRAEEFKIWKGSLKWFLTNLIFRDYEKNKNRIDIDQI